MHLYFTKPPFYRMVPLLQVRQLSPTVLNAKTIQTNLAIAYTVLTSSFPQKCIYICMCILSARLSVYHLCDWWLQEPEEVIISPRATWLLGIKPRSSRKAANIIFI